MATGRRPERPAGAAAHAARWRLAAPPGRMRRSLALYYFSNGCPADECLESDCEKPHTTLWQAPNGCARCQEATCSER